MNKVLRILRSSTTSINRFRAGWALAVFVSFGPTIMAQPVLNVLGNSQLISNGDATPSLLDDTHFGITSEAVGLVSRTYFIENIGNAPLQFTGPQRVEITGPDPADFTVVEQPPVDVLQGGQSVTFRVVFNPTALGVRLATIRIQSNDPDDNPYEFSIMGLSDFDIRECSDPCTGEDVTLSDVELRDENGEVYPPVLCGQPGVTILSTLYITINNNTSANRRAIRLACDVFIDGKDSGEDILACYDGPIPGNTSVTIPIGTLTYSYGSVVELRNVKIAWRTANSGTCGNTITCNDYPGGQCAYIDPEHDFIVSTPLSSNFEKVGTPLCESALTLEFLSTATGGTPPYTYSWNFGDPASGPNNTSTSSNPSHEYSSAGLFNVSLVVTDSNGVQCSITLPVFVQQPTLAVASGGGTVTCAMPALTLTSLGSSSGPNISYQWVSPNGNILSGANTTSPVVNQAGIYTLIVTDANTGCTSSASVNVFSDQSPPLASSGPPQLLTCLQSTVQLQGAGSSGPGINILWTANPGSIVSGGNTYTPLVDAPGTYTLLVTNLNSGCSSSAIVQVSADQTPPQANAGPTSTLTCLQPSYQIQGSGSAGPEFVVHWLASPGNIVSGANTYNPVIDQPGHYTLLVTNTANGCTTTASITVDDDTSPPEVAIAPPDILTCTTSSVTLDAGASSQGPGIQYSWTAAGAGNILSGNTTSSPIVDQPGTYLLTITNTVNGCTAAASVAVLENIQPPLASAGPGNTLTCTVQQLALNGSASAGSNYTYNWTTTNGNIVAGNTTLNPVINSAGTYTLLVTNLQNGCTAQSSATVGLDQAAPLAVASGPLVLDCSHATVTLDGGGSSTGPGMTYQWVANPGVILSGANTLNNAVVNAPGTYTLIVVNAVNGCTAEASVDVVEDLVMPTASILPPDMLTCTRTSLQLNAAASSQGSALVYIWTTSDGNIQSGNGTLTPVIDQPGTYSLVVLNPENGCSDTASVLVAQDTALPIAAASPAAPITCLLGQVQLNGAGSSTGSSFRYQWSTLTGSIIGGETTLNPTVNQAGTYFLTVTNLDNGCTAQTAVTVTSNLTQPVAIAAAPQEITCISPTVSLSGNGSSQGPAYAYIWNTQDGQIISGVNSLNPVVGAAGTYQLIVVNLQSGCSATTTVGVTANTALPIAAIAPGGTLSCAVTNLNLDGSGSSTGPGFTYWWSSPSGAILSGQGTLFPQIGAAGTYSLQITNTASGCTAIASTTVAADMSVPLALAGPPDTLTCLKTQTSLNGTASDTGAQISYSWTGPGILSGENTLTPEVNQPGVYTLLVTNTSNGCSASSSVLVAQDNVPPMVTAGPVMVLTCKESSLALQGGSGSNTGLPFSYEWLASSGGNILSGGNSLTPLINAPGIYSLTVTNLVNGCTASDSVVVTQDTLAPVVAVAAPGQITCANTTVMLNGSGSTGPQFSYHWTSIDGSIQSGATTLTPTVSAAGTYQLEVQNQINGCTAVASVEVEKDISVPQAVAQIPNRLTCTVAEIQLDGSGSSSGPGIEYLWTTASGQILSGATTLMPIVNAPGQYTLEVLNSSNNCKALFTVEVSQDTAPPSADAGPPALLTCVVTTLVLDGSNSSQGTEYTYQWSTINGRILNGANTLFPQVDRAGFYTLVVIDTQNGCTAESMVPVLLDQTAPQAVAGPDMSLTCTTSEIALNATGTSTGSGFSYQWTSSAGGNILSGANTLQPVVDAPGAYSLLVTNPDNGCTSSDTVLVILDQTPPVASIASPEVLNCMVQTVTLNTSGSSAGPSFAYQWTTMNGAILSGANSPAPVVNQPGVYQLLLTNLLNHCTATASALVVQNIEMPLVDAGAAEQLNCSVTSLSLNGTVSNAGANPQYVWTTSNGNIVSGINTLNPVIDASGTYWLTVTNPDNHCRSTDHVQVLSNTVLPLAVAAAGPDLTCTLLATSLNAAGSSAGTLFSYQWSAQNGGNLVSGANTATPWVDAPGVYVLTVTNLDNRCTATASVMINQDQTPPEAVATSPGVLDCTVSSLVLAGAGSSTGSVFQYEWQSMGGYPVSGFNTLSPVVVVPDTYTLIVTNTANGCTATAMVEIAQDTVRPLAVAKASSPITCLIATPELSGLGSSSGNAYAYQWTTTNGKLDSGDTTLFPIVSAPGTYNLLVVNTLNGCTQTATATVAQDVSQPSVFADAGGAITCSLTQLYLSGAGAGGALGVSYQWTTADGSILSGANAPNPVVTSGGSYRLTVTDLFNGCTAEAVVVVLEDTTALPAVVAPPGMLTCLQFSLTLNAMVTASGTPYTYSWSGPGLIAPIDTLQPTINQPGDYTFQVINQLNGCISAATVEVTQNIQMPTADAGEGFELTCQIQDGYLDAGASSSGSDISFAWTTVDGNILNGASQPTPLVDAAGLYALLVTNTSSGCTAVDTVWVTENTSVPNDLELDIRYPDCQGNPGAVLVKTVEGGTEPYLYSIDGGDTFRTETLFDELPPGDYQLVVQDANGCVYDRDLHLPTPTLLSVTLPPDVTLAYGDSTTLVAGINIPLSQIDTILWSPMEDITPTHLPNMVQVKTFFSKEYTVTVVDTSGCMDRATIYVKIGDPNLWAPNAISSNKQDGFNDVFLIFAGPNSVRNIRTLQIYDRWGNMVFRNDNIQPNDEKLGWNGHFRGKPMNPAVFVWWADVELYSGQKIIMKGDVTIVD